jgi:hypothetical protein
VSPTCSEYWSSEEDELTLERQFEVTKNIWENLVHEPKREPKLDQDEDIIIPDVAPAPSDPIYQVCMLNLEQGPS